MLCKKKKKQNNVTLEVKLNELQQLSKRGSVIKNVVDLSVEMTATGGYKKEVRH